MSKLRFLFLLIALLLPGLVFAQNSPPSLPQSLDEEILAATRKSDLEKVKALLAKGANVNAKSSYGATPLFFACDRKSIEMVRLLLDHGADPNVRDTFYKATPFLWALQKEDATIIRLLVEKGAKETAMALNFGVNGNHPDVVKIALEKGSFKPDDLTKPLRTANLKGHKEIAELLKKAGATPPTEFNVSAETLKLYEGKYADAQRTLIVKVKDGKLTASINDFEMELIPVSEHAFDVVGQDGRAVIFKLENNISIEATYKYPQGQTVVKKEATK